MRVKLNTKALVAEAKRNPWKLFNCGELAAILDVDDSLVTAIKKKTDTVFIGSKARPEWVLRWMESHGGFSGK